MWYENIPHESWNTARVRSVLKMSGMDKSFILYNNTTSSTVVYSLFTFTPSVLSNIILLFTNKPTNEIWILLLILQWFRHPLNPRDRRNFAVDFACGAVLTPLVVISAWLCLNGSAHYMRHDLMSLEGLGLTLLAIVLIGIFSTWALVSSIFLM